MHVMPGLNELLHQQPALRLAPVTDDIVRLAGRYCLDATHASAGRVALTVELQVCVPPTFPRDYPAVYEIGGRIPRDADWHVNEHDGSLCLGSRLGLLAELQQSPRLDQFLVRTLDPFLYAVAVKLRNGGEFVFGELRHGGAGITQDLAERLQIPESAIALAFARLAEPDELACTKPCPCGCGRSLAKCETNERICAIRALETSRWFAQQAINLA